MTDPRTPPKTIIKGVLHPTDFSEGSLAAFHHALKAALLAKSRLTLLHVSSDGSSEWSDFPGVRETLERWGLLSEGSPRSAVAGLGIDVEKVIAARRAPVEAVLGFLDEHPAELIVLATHQNDGRMRWLKEGVAEPLARQAEEMTLFIPEGSAGFVAPETGAVSLQNILIPVAASPRPQPALEAAVRLARELNCPQGTFTLLHVGDLGAMPVVHRPELPGWEWAQLTVQGDVIESIVATAAKIRADLIVMTTDGRNGFLDALRGSHSERVLRHAVAPLLTVPVASSASARLR